MVGPLTQMELTGRGATWGRWKRVGERDGESSLGHVFEVSRQQPEGTIQNILDNDGYGGGEGRDLGKRNKSGRCVSLYPGSEP